MQRILASSWFLAATAVCCGLAVAFTTWVTHDSSGGARALAGLLGLGAGLALMMLVAWALAAEDDAPAVTAPTDSGARPALALVSPTAATESQPVQETARSVLTLRLEEGRALRQELEPGASDARVGVWIESARQSIEGQRPGLVGYFDALSARAYANDAERLDAHLGRLETILRDFL